MSAADFFALLGGFAQAKGPLLIPTVAVQSVAASIGNGETYAPDVRKGMEHNITITGAAVTIDNPIGFGSPVGWTPLLVTHVRNASGGAITITWGSLYRQAAFVDPTNGNGVITLWHFDASTGLWYSSARNTVANA